MWKVLFKEWIEFYTSECDHYYYQSECKAFLQSAQINVYVYQMKMRLSLAPHLTYVEVLRAVMRT